MERLSNTNALRPTSHDFLNEAETRGYVVYKKAQYALNLNIVGWRNLVGRSNRFDDYIALYWQEGQEWVTRIWPAATRPGLEWLQKPMNPKGAAIVVPGQYIGAYQLGNYRGYTALKQVKPLKVFRDNNQDSLIDADTATIEEGLFGIHIHKAGMLSNLIGLWSAGCQVFRSSNDYAEFIKLCSVSAQIWGNSFSYTLMEF